MFWTGLGTPSASSARTVRLISRKNVSAGMASFIVGMTSSGEFAFIIFMNHLIILAIFCHPRQGGDIIIGIDPAIVTIARVWDPLAISADLAQKND
jgi:hypothetical protein